MESDQPVRSDRGVWLRRVATALVVGLVVYLAWQIWDRDVVMRWIANLRPLPFFIAMTVLPAVGIPFTPLYILAGASFNVPLAIVGTLLALAANLCICYVIGSSGLRRRLVRLFTRFGYELPSFETREGEATLRASIRFTALVKFAPGVPGFVKHYGLGAARVPFLVYFAFGMIVSGAYAVALIVFGDSLLTHELDRGTIVLLVAAGLALLLRWWVRRQKTQALQPAVA